MMHHARRRRGQAACVALAFAVLPALGAPATAQAGKTAYPAMAAIERYRSENMAEEIAFARSAAPASVSAGAEILTLGAKGYEVAVKGGNGFTCLVERAWANDFDNGEFWNPNVRAPFCYNAAGARSVLPTYLERTKWVLAGASIEEMAKRTKAALADKRMRPPEPGAMCYMMSKDGYLGDEAGHWHPHLMFFVPKAAPEQWGANLPGSPVTGGASEIEPLSVFRSFVPNWSDGSPAPMGAM